MIVVNVFGEIEPIIISEKLGLTLSNLPQDWQEELVETMKEEIYYREYDVKKYSSLKNFEQYDVKTIVENRNFSGIFDRGNKNYLTEIAKKLICIGVENFEDSMLQKKNSFIDSPTCEIEFGEKLINFYEFLTRSHYNNNKWIPLTCMYSSEKSLYEQTHILRMLYGEMGCKR